ncbi:MAG: adenine phosphoribosyltransferase [Arenimonas sp.]|nr:adenine phosphoribosyltransferase [Arenimonas sp.]
MRPEALAGFAGLVRDVPDFPRPGIVFKDILPLLADGRGFAAAVAAMAQPWRDARVSAVAGVEARGFILGAALARELDVGFVPIRKPGKLPGAVHEVSYDLEYGSDRLQVQQGALAAGERVLLVDDVLATGGTLLAAAHLLGNLRVELLGAAVLVELAALGGRARWRDPSPVLATLVY